MYSRTNSGGAATSTSRSARPGEGPRPEVAITTAARTANASPAIATFFICLLPYHDGGRRALALRPPGCFNRALIRLRTDADSGRRADPADVRLDDDRRGRRRGGLGRAPPRERVGPRARVGGNKAQGRRVERRPLRPCW